MTGIFSRLKSVFDLSNTRPKSTAPSTSTIVEELSTFDIATAQHGFYTTILGDNDKPFTVPQKLVQSVVKKSLSDKEQRVKSVPRLPSVIPRLLHSLRDPRASGKDYVNIINKDPAMSTAVLKLANSVYFNPTEKRVTSIEMAVVKLGIDGLRSALSTAVMQPVMQCKSQYFTEFGHKLWFHSRCCAVACEIAAKERALEPFKAYLLGLVHDIGKITLFSALSQQLAINTDNEEPGYAAFAPPMQADSAQLSYTIAKDWQLPEELCDALEQQIQITPGTKLSALAHLLFQANLACEIYAITEADSSQRELGEQALRELTLPADLFATLDTLRAEQ